MSYQPYMKCPVCDGKETIVEEVNADYLETCVECGTPLSEFIEDENTAVDPDMVEEEKVLYARKYFLLHLAQSDYFRYED